MPRSGYRTAVDRLCAALGRLPGIGAKSAERLAHHLLKCTEAEAFELADAIREVKSRIRHCQNCCHLTEAEEPLCDICRDPLRDQTTICVVEQSRDLLTLEKSAAFRGLYHVLLGRLSPLSGIGPDSLSIDTLVERVSAGTIQEVVLATNPNLEGDGTALLIAERLAQFPIRVTRLARGLASGGTLEFANRDMLADAFVGRRPV